MPIGNLDDISLRGLKTLNESSMIILEEYKVGKKNLDLLNVQTEKKEIAILNEHTTAKEIKQLLAKMEAHKSISLISDQGFPVFADPGWELIDLARKKNIAITVLPGASCLLVALCASGFLLEQFFYVGFLKRETKKRLQQLRELAKVRSLLVILDTPYRLASLLKAVFDCFLPTTQVAICMSLTMEEEEIFRGTLAQAYNRYAKKEKNKKPFVLLIDNQPKSILRKRKK